MPSDTGSYPLAVGEQIENLQSSPDHPSDRCRPSLRGRYDRYYMALSWPSGLAGLIAGVMVVYLFFPSLLAFQKHGQAFPISSKGLPMLGLFRHVFTDDQKQPLWISRFSKAKSIANRRRMLPTPRGPQ